MLAMPSLKLPDMKHVLHAYPRVRSLSPPWSPKDSRFILHRRQSSTSSTSSTSKSDEPQHPQPQHTHALTWKAQPRGTYTADDSEVYAYSATLSAELPLSSAAMSVLAEGEVLGKGAVTFQQGTSESMRVDVRVYYNSPEVQKVTSLSYTHTPNNENGVRIHTSSTAHALNLHRFISILITLPSAASLPAFRTHLPNFTHTIRSLPSVHFHTLSLSTSDAPVVLGSLHAGRVRVRTSGAPITVERVEADEAVSLRTSGADVRGDVRMSGQGLVEVFSSDGEITLNLNIPTTSSSASKTKTPAYTVRAHTTQKPISLTASSFTSNYDSDLAPVVHYDVQTSNAPATLNVPGFVGSFSLHSTPHKPSVSSPSSERDVVIGRERRGLSEGVIRIVGDETPHQPASGVVVRTSNAVASLVL